MRSLLEQAVIHHLNGDSEKAQELFHQFIVTRARQIHESMRNGEDPMEEGLDDEDITTEEYFNESDLDELEDLEDDNVDGDEEAAADFDAAGDADEDAAADDFDAAGDEEAAADDFGSDLDDAGEPAAEGGEVEELEARVEDLEAELERLVAKFDSDEANFDDEDADIADGIDDDMAGSDVPPAADEDEPFEGLGESAATELEKVSATNAPETEVGAGKKISANEKSGLTQKNAAARQGGEPIKTKSKNHKGYEREAAPAVASMQKRKNNLDHANSALSGVAAPSNTDGTEVGAGKKISVNTKSPVVPAKGLQK